MEYWAVTKDRAQQTLTVWNQHVPTLNIGTQGPLALGTLIAGFEPLAQAVVAAQDVTDAAVRAVQGALGTMRVLGTKLPQIIEGQLDGNAGILRDVKDLYANTPRTEASILRRLRELLPVWVRANAVLAAMVPAQAAIVRVVGGVAFTAAAAKTLLDSYTNLIGTRTDKDGLLSNAKEALKEHDSTTDSLIKRWYKVVKATADVGTPLADALDGIPTEQGTPAPTIIDIATVTQGGADGLHAEVDYTPGGGDHATTKTLRWKVVGVDADFIHSVPIDRTGNEIGPFTEGQVVKLFGEVSNSSGTRTTAERTLTIGVPIV